MVLRFKRKRIFILVFFLVLVIIMDFLIFDINYLVEVCMIVFLLKIKDIIIFVIYNV